MHIYCVKTSDPIWHGNIKFSISGKPPEDLQGFMVREWYREATD